MMEPLRAPRSHIKPRSAPSRTGVYFSRVSNRAVECERRLARIQHAEKWYLHSGWTVLGVRTDNAREMKTVLVLLLSSRRTRGIYEPTR
ncbi:hypothetical protein MHYP_G00352500 [Metynnis hypsauchen]